MYARNLYSFIVADELDFLYHTVAFLDKKIQILNELAILGGSSAGRTYTIVCGSSAVLPGLVCKNLVYEGEDLIKEFPLIKDAPSLNSSKYAPFRISQSNPSDDTQSIRQNLVFPAVLTLEEMNQLHFLAGTNLRKMSDLHAAVRKGAGGDAEQICCGSETWDLRADRTRQRYFPLIDALDCKLIKRNKQALCALSRIPVKDVAAYVSEQNWAQIIQPLPRNNIDMILRDVNAKNNTQYSRLTVMWLGDKGFSAHPDLQYVCSSTTVF